MGLGLPRMLYYWLLLEEKVGRGTLTCKGANDDFFMALESKTW